MVCLVPFLFAVLPYSVAYMLYLAEATGSNVYEQSGSTLDISNTDKGYFMFKRQSDKKQKLRVSTSSGQYDYDINGDGTFEIIPLQMGSGNYSVTLYEQTSGNQYASKFSKDFSVSLESGNINFLYPNQYVNFDANTQAVEIANQICEGLTTAQEKYAAVRDYIKQNVVYDYMTAIQITGGALTSYLPDVDNTLQKKMGICFDYASLAACMLRSQDVPTKFVIGYADNAYHAWNEILIDGQWARFDLTFSVTGTKVSDGGYMSERIY